jgi:hypothetical protein
VSDFCPPADALAARRIKTTESDTRLMKRGPMAAVQGYNEEEVFEGKLAAFVGSRDGPSHAVIAEHGQFAHNHFPTGGRDFG